MLLVTLASTYIANYIALHMCPAARPERINFHSCLDTGNFLLQVALVTPGDAKRFDALQAALNRPAPPEFPVVRFHLRPEGCAGGAKPQHTACVPFAVIPQNEALLPAVHARVALALRLDTIVHNGWKASTSNIRSILLVLVSAGRSAAAGGARAGWAGAAAGRNRSVRRQAAR